MIFRPSDETRLWDPWILQVDDVFHMWYLEAPLHSKTFPNLGHAVSTDLAHWQQLPSIPLLGPAGAWDETPNTSGTTLRHEGRYYMFYGGHEVPQQIGVMVSDDLERWTRHPDNPLLSPELPYYQTVLGPRLPVWYVSFRDPCVVWDPSLQRYDAYISATTASASPGFGTCIGHATSTDLINWELHPPVLNIPELVMVDLPQYFQMGNDHYLIFSVVDGRGKPFDVPGREWVSGVFYAHSESRHGEYSMPDNPFLFGSGHGRHEGYAGLTIQVGKERLFYHHTRSQPIDSARFPFGMKRISRKDNGALELTYWPGHGLLEKGEVRAGSLVREEDLRGGTDLGVGQWDSDGGYITGKSDLVASASYGSESWADFHIECNIAPQTAVVAGLLLRYDPATRKGVLVVLDFRRGAVEVCGTKLGWRWIGRSVWDRVTLSLNLERPNRLRVLCRAEFIEVYVDDVWMFTTALQDRPSAEALDEIPKAGRVGYFVEDGAATFSDVRLACFEPLP